MGWLPELDATAHAASLAGVRERIAAGETYQPNFTFPLEAPLAEEPAALFARLVAAQRPRHAAYVDIGRFAIVSASPELFFERAEGLLRTRPMQGKAPRGPTPEQDDAAAAALTASEKERAENLMLVDMLRNDLGRVAEPGSVETASLFDVERYPTLLQMTSSVTARATRRCRRSSRRCSRARRSPARRRSARWRSSRRRRRRRAGSTRAPSAGPAPRAAPPGASRSAPWWPIATAASRASAPAAASWPTRAPRASYQECLLKARILDEPPFALVETFAHLPGEASAASTPTSRGSPARRATSAFRSRCGGSRRRVGAAGSLVGAARIRLSLHGDGRVEVEATTLPMAPTHTLQVGLAARPVDPGSLWLYHKTTRREVYDEAAASRPDCDDVLLWNDRGELTESTIASVVVEIAGQRLTPPLACGLLPGVERARALAEGRAREGVVRISELQTGQRLWLLSSLRGSREARLVG